MNLSNKLWTSFKLNPDIWFFYGFLITLTLSIRKVLFFYPIQGQFNEYTGIYLYLSDIFLLLVLISVGVSILYNKILLKSRYIIGFIAYLKQKVVIIPLLLIIFSFISAFWSANWEMAIFRSIKLLEFYLLYLWVIFRMFHVEHFCYRIGTSSRNILRNMILVVVGTGFIQSIVGIWQFIAQKSVGLIWLKESIISPDIPGVAKIVLDGGKYIRSYGLFPHPNILGGFLVLSIILTILYFKMFHVEHFTRQVWHNSTYYSVLGIQTIALILTFSKSAWLGLAIAIVYLWYQNVPRGTFWQKGIKKMFHVEHWKYFALLAGIIFLTVIIIKPDWYLMAGKSIRDRIFYLNVSPARFAVQSIAGERGTGAIELLFGTGNGQSVLFLQNLTDIQDWQFQPVHNVFLLILNELGVIGLFLFVWFIWKAVRNKLFHVEQFICYWDGTLMKYTKAIFYGFLFIMLFDHYFWDIQQGKIMIWLVLGIIAGCKVWTSREVEHYPQDKTK